MAKITLRTIHGDMTMPGRLVGPFAIHRGIANTQSWTVTHVGTGWAIAIDLHSEDSADRIAGAVLPLADWSFDSPKAIVVWPKADKDKIRGLIRTMKRDDQLRAEGVTP